MQQLKIGHLGGNIPFWDWTWIDKRISGVGRYITSYILGWVLNRLTNRNSYVIRLMSKNIIENDKMGW